MLVCLGRNSMIVSWWYLIWLGHNSMKIPSWWYLIYLMVVPQLVGT